MSLFEELIEDRSTLQMGIGSIPNAVLSRLTNHKNLGLHTEMFSDGVIDLILKDVINGNFRYCVSNNHFWFIKLSYHSCLTGLRLDESHSA